MSGRGDRVNVRYFMFLTLGICRTYRVSKKVEGIPTKPLSEPPESRICRRNILALASMLVIAGAAGGDPHDLTVFGVELTAGWGDVVLGAAAIGAHIYWYAMRYFHAAADGMIPAPRYSAGVNPHRPADPVSENHNLERKTADLWANRVAFVLTILSWYFIAQWICGPDG
jgi:hypothetical protein